MDKYLILNENNIAQTPVEYEHPLLNVSANCIKVEDFSMLWHKYENGAWSTESYAPTITEKIVTNEEIKQNQIVIMSAINDLYTMISNLNQTSTGSST